MIPQLSELSHEDIREHVAQWFKINADDITSNRRHAWRVQLRAALCYVLRYDYHWTQEQLANLINRDRTTVKHLLMMMEDAITTDNKHTCGLLHEATKCIRQLSNSTKIALEKLGQTIHSF